MENSLIIISEESIKNKIYNIRGKNVMLDSDLAEIYEYTTKTFNQQVKNNIDRFDLDFRFQLTNEETLALSRSKNLTLNKGRGHNIKYNPYVFTEEGIYMLMTVLKGELAVMQSKSLIKIFKSMKDYMVSNNILEQKYINKLVLEDHDKIKILENTFNKLNEKQKVNTIFFEGQIYDSHSLLLDILTEVDDEIIIIDNYAGKELLDILKNIDKKIIIVSNNIDDILKKKYESQYKNITFINNNTFHDRFLIIDRKKLYSCGSSFKDLGKKCFYIGEIDSKEMLDNLLNRIGEINENGCYRN